MDSMLAFFSNATEQNCGHQVGRGELSLTFLALCRANQKQINIIVSGPEDTGIPCIVELNEKAMF